MGTSKLKNKIDQGNIRSEVDPCLSHEQNSLVTRYFKLYIQSTSNYIPKDENVYS